MALKKIKNKKPERGTANDVLNESYRRRAAGYMSAYGRLNLYEPLACLQATGLLVRLWRIKSY
jgi:hypothetical protein